MSTPTKIVPWPAGLAMELARDQLLARPVLAEDEDVGLGPGDLLDDREDLFHGRARAR